MRQLYIILLWYNLQDTLLKWRKQSLEQPFIYNKSIYTYVHKISWCDTKNLSLGTEIGPLGDRLKGD